MSEGVRGRCITCCILMRHVSEAGPVNSTNGVGLKWKNSIGGKADQHSTNSVGSLNMV